MTWFAALQLAKELLTVIIPIIGQLFGDGNKEVEPAKLPAGLKQKVVELADHVKASA